MVGTEGERPEGLLEEDLDFAARFLPYLSRRVVTRPSTQTEKRRQKRLELLANQCREIRQDLEMSRRALATQLDVDHVQLAAFENGLVPLADMPEGFAQRLRATYRTAVRAKERDKGSSLD